MSDEGPQIRVKFVTKNAAIRVTETPFAVPTRLNRQGLSQVVNHLLNTTTPRPFDFLIENVFLRVSLDKYMQRNSVSEESVLTLEYVEALPEPSEAKAANHPDWVSAVSVANEFVVTGCYDGNVRVYQLGTGECLATTKAHYGAVKSVRVQALPNSNELLIASSGKDQLGQLWRFDAKTNALVAVAALTEHLNSVDAVDLSADASHAVTGSWDNTIRVWTVPTGSTSVSDGDGEAPVTKKRKQNATKAIPSFQQLQASTVLVGHTSQVTGVAFDSSNLNRIVSGSSDRSVRLWDVETHSCVQTMAGNRAITNVSMNVDGLILSSHPDHCIRLWDPRATQAGEQFVQQTFQSHKAWVNAVSWHPTSASTFVSCGYDGAVKVWDMRSSIPLHSIVAHDGKALDVAWQQTSELAFVSGGEDKQLKVFSV